MNWVIGFLYGMAWADLCSPCQTWRMTLLTCGGALLGTGLRLWWRRVPT